MIDNHTGGICRLPTEAPRKEMEAIVDAHPKA
jgi:hypothetical protein